MLLFFSSLFFFFSFFLGFLAFGLHPSCTEIRDDSRYRYGGLITCQLMAGISASR